jgi:hypothetical protein
MRHGRSSTESATQENSYKSSPLRAIRTHCQWCCNGKASEVALCPARRCSLWLLRSGHRPKLADIEHNADVTLHPSERRTTVGELYGGGGAVLKAIRLRCLDCSGNSLCEVRSCNFDTCPLHPFRFGKNPNIRLSPERKAELLTRLHR